MISHILLDIEGTTCPVSFVTETLFPYAQSALKEFSRKAQRNDPLSRLNSLITQTMNGCKIKSEESTTLRQQSEKMQQQAKYLRVEAYLQLLIALPTKNQRLLKIFKARYGKKDIQQAESLQNCLKTPMKV